MPLNAGLLVKAVRTLSFKISLGSAVLLLAGAGVANAQIATRAVPDRLVQPINESARVTLGGTVHPLANKANDLGAAADSLKLDRVQIILKRSDAQEAELKQAISDMHAPGNASYHRWLTPDEFGKRFGPSDADVAKLTNWLQSHGFSVTKLNAGRQTLEMTGSAGQFRDTFKTQIHSYQVKSAAGNSLETHYANASDPQIPAALAPVLGGFASLNNFRLKSYSHKLGTASYNAKTHESKPEWTTTIPDNPTLLLAPGDFAVQYNLPNQTTAGTNDGTGQSIAIINESNINISLVNRFRTLFNLAANPPQVIIDGNDPGIDGINNPDGQNGASIEAYLDVETAGEVAPAATVNLVIGADTAVESGLAFAAERAVYSNISPVISLSFGLCEAELGSGNAFWNGLWEQAAAQGITVMVSSGDSGSAGCDGSGQAFAVGGQAVSGEASTPYNVAVGGTDFYYTGGSAGFSTYWNLTPSNNTPTVSLLKQVPEQPWNNSQYGLNAYNFDADNGDTTISGGSGGASTCATGTVATDGSYTSCTAGYPKPSWQKGTGVPTDGVRDIPDVSLFAAFLQNASAYPLCAEDGDCEPVSSTGDVQVTPVGGTSASSPAFAGIMALVNQQYGRQGQANFVLYPLATQFPAAFNDVTVGTNAMPCNLQTVYVTSDNVTYSYPPTDCQTVSNELEGDDSTYGSSIEGEIGLTAGDPAYNAGTGYDLASGLGTVNVTNLLADWGKVTFASTAVTLAASTTTITHGTPVTLSGTVTGTGTPTGDVALATDANLPLQGRYFTLAGGLYSGSVVLPGGMYDIWGTYGGDNANAASSSVANKVQVTVAPEASTTTLSAYTANVTSTSFTYVNAPATLSYGQQVVLSAVAKPSSGSTTDSVPTGNVAFTNNGAALNTALVNAEGDAEYFGTYPVSSTAYSIKAAYAGDNSYQASTSSAASFTVTKNTPALYLGISNADSQGNIYGPQQTFLNVLIENSNAYSQNALAPTGTVTVTGGPSGTLTGTLSPGVGPNTNSPIGTVTLALPVGLESGTYNLAFSYAGDSNYNAVPASENTTYSLPFSPYGTGLTSTTTVAASAATTSPTGTVQVTTTITGKSGSLPPSGSITVYLSGFTLGTFTLPAGTGFSTVGTLTFDSEAFIQGSNLITVQYSGDTNYLPSAGTATVSNPLSDFQIVPLTTIVNVPTSGTATDTINLTSTNSFAGAVTFTCKGAGGVTCSTNPAAATLAAGGSTSVSLTVSSAGVTTTGTYNVVVTASDSLGNFVHTLGLEAVVPQLAVVTPGITVTNNAAITIASQGASGTSMVSVTPSGGFTGTVALTCAITSSPTGATETPTCALTPPSITIGDTAVVTTATLTVSTTAQTTTTQLKLLLFGGSGITMAALFFFGGPIGRRGWLTLRAMKTMRLLSAAALFALIAGAAMGCGGSSSTGSGGSGGGGTTTGGTTIGAYTVTVTATPASGTAATTTVAVTVN